jgi:hypothetical protein
VTTIRRNPATSATSASSVPSKNCSSFICSMSNASEPALPLTSSRIWFLRPVANRVASKLATAPPAKRPRNSAASSTVTAPRPLPSGSGRSRTNVSVSPHTPVSRSPVTNCARSTTCAPMSPRARPGAFGL